MRRATSNNSATVATTKDEGKLLISRDDGDTLRRIQQIVGYAFIGCIHDLPEDLGCLLHAITIVLAVGCSCDRACNQKNGWKIRRCLIILSSSS